MNNEIPVSHTFTAAEDLLSKVQAHVSLPNGPKKQENLKALFPVFSDTRMQFENCVAHRKSLLQTIHEIEDAQRIAESRNGSIHPAAHTFMAYQKQRAISALK